MNPACSPPTSRVITPHLNQIEGAQKAALRQARGRMKVLGALYGLGCLVIFLRLSWLAIMGVPEEFAAPLPPPSVNHSHRRADIVDRNGVLLATSLASLSLYADPALILQASQATEGLVGIFPDLNYGETLRRLQGEGRFVWIKRNLTPQQVDAVNNLGVPGLSFREEWRRVYPNGNALAHILGSVDIDGNGLAGLEKSFDKTLKQGAAPLKLAIDSRFQYALTREMQNTMTEFNAIGAAGLIVDARNGEVMAAASLPDYDPNKMGDAVDDQKFNRVALGVYEMGSTFKIFNTALALGTGTFQISDQVDTTRPLRRGRFTITDYHPENRWLTISEVFTHSSNIGSGLMAMAVGAEKQREFLTRLGLTRPAELEIPEVGAPIVPNPWKELSAITISYGHGISITPLHLARAVVPMINGGILYDLTLIKHPDQRVVQGEQVISPQISDIMRRLMRAVVLDGTAKMAEKEGKGWLIGGKTGTSEKLVNGRYVKNARVSSFVGAFPMHAPRYVVYVMIDEPKATKATYGYATGGWVAAPAVGRIVARIGALSGMVPFDEASPEIQSALMFDHSAGRMVRVESAATKAANAAAAPAEFTPINLPTDTDPP